uniref:Uncharacterized protein n=1 Tax=Knipowitschia caucasica TaxID=637954 RepID=A0AAV2MPE3_KNICA
MGGRRYARVAWSYGMPTTAIGVRVHQMSAVNDTRMSRLRQTSRGHALRHGEVLRARYYGYVIVVIWARRPAITGMHTPAHRDVSIGVGGGGGGGGSGAVLLGYLLGGAWGVGGVHCF